MYLSDATLRIKIFHCFQFLYIFLYISRNVELLYERPSHIYLKLHCYIWSVQVIYMMLNFVIYSLSVRMALKVLDPWGFALRIL